MKLQMTIILAAIALVAGIAQADPVDLAQNGGFETGDFDGWSLFPTGEDQFTVVMPGSEGDYAARIYNTVDASAALMKNANVGMGVVEANMEITISFDARGSLEVGAVAFAEFFSELEGGGVSASEILGGGPLALNADPAVWTNFTFTTTTGPDVSGGVTLQLTGTTGADSASMADVYYDNVTMVVDAIVPVESMTFSDVKSLF